MATRPAKGNISAGFGMRKHPITGKNTMHNGEDIGWGNGGGTAIYAPISGTVISYGASGGHGNRLRIQNGNTVVSLSHLASSKVGAGAYVSEGQHIATMGATGNVTGVHVHWEVEVGGRLVDPAVWVQGSPSHPPFPLPAGWYFGPKSGPKKSVSGYYGHREDLRAWQQRMKDRGWPINPDGLRGDQTRRIALAFQKEKGLYPDGLIGVDTWNAAWTTPIT